LLTDELTDVGATGP